MIINNTRYERRASRNQMLCIAWMPSFSLQRCAPPRLIWYSEREKRRSKTACTNRHLRRIWFRLLHLLACNLLFVAHLYMYHGTSRLLQWFLLLDGTFYTTRVVVRLMQVVQHNRGSWTAIQPLIHVTTLDNSAFNMINVNGYGHFALRDQPLGFYIGSSVVVTGGGPKLSCPNR